MLIASTNLRKQSLHTKAQKDESWKFPWHFIWWYFSSSQVCWSVLQTVGNKCFDKCVTKPGSSLSGSESSCISRCVDRYIEATGIVSRALFSSQRWSPHEQGVNDLKDRSWERCPHEIFDLSEYNDIWCLIVQKSPLIDSGIFL